MGEKGISLGKIFMGGGRRAKGDRCGIRERKFGHRGGKN